MSKEHFNPSRRLRALPPYLFVEIDREKRKARQQGRDIIDIGIGDPDQPTPKFIISVLNQAAQDSANHHYALDAGLLIFREEIARWYKERFSVILDPLSEIYPLIGSKEGLAHLPLGIINPGDTVLIPDPAYPVYQSAATFAGAKIKVMPLLDRNAFLPQLERIGKAKLVYVNYPNNPTSALAGLSFYRDLVAIARKEQMAIASDLAYSEIYYDGKAPHSILEVAGAKEVAIEFHSLSKTFNMTGWRIGWACGNKNLISALANIKSNIDSGIFQAIQLAGIAALKDKSNFCDQMRQLFQERRDIFVQSLNRIGWKVDSPSATFYIWARVPTKESSIAFSKRLLQQANIVCTPGVGFGKYGRGFVRFALTVSRERLAEAADRIKKVI